MGSRQARRPCAWAHGRESVPPPIGSLAPRGGAMALFQRDDSAGRQHRDSPRQLLDRVWRVQRYHERGIRCRREFLREPVGREVVTKRWIDIVNTAWDETPKAHAVNN